MKGGHFERGKQRLGILNFFQLIYQLLIIHPANIKFARTVGWIHYLRFFFNSGIKNQRFKIRCYKMY